MIAILADQRVLSATSMGNAHVTTMLKARSVIDVKRTNTTDIKVAWIVSPAIIWFRMLQTNIVRNYKNSTIFCRYFTFIFILAFINSYFYLIGNC